jgi:hypothetical protein
MNRVKTLLAVGLLLAMTFTGCAASGGIPAGGISQGSGNAVKAEAKNTNVLTFGPMKDTQIQGLMADVAKQCSSGEVVNGIYRRDDLNLFVVSFEKASISGFCKQ